MRGASTLSVGGLGGFVGGLPGALCWAGISRAVGAGGSNAGHGRFNLETAVGPSVGRVPSRGGGDDSCPVRRVRGPGLQSNRAYLDLTRRVSPWVPVHEPIRPDGKGVYSFWYPH